MSKIGEWFHGSIARAILSAFLLLSVLPIALIAFLFVNDSAAALRTQMESNLDELAQARANEINLRLQEVRDQTVMVAYYASHALQQPLTPGQVEQALKRYQADSRQIVGLDVYYQAAGGQDVLGQDLSNVYWNYPLDPQTGRKIVNTETLDTIFAGVKMVSPDTQWIYLTTPEGMMRLYPWASNDNYPAAWDPRQIIFYTVAEPAHNPTLQPQWTPAYVDFAGAGWMVTLSVPVVDAQDNFIGIVSHDITINTLKDMALETQILSDDDYGFLIDQDGNVIAHPDYEDKAATEGTQSEVNLLAVGSPEFRGLIEKMVKGEAGLGQFSDPQRGEQILVYQPIPAIGWRLGIVVPQSKVLAPVLEMRNRAFLIAVLVSALAIVLAIYLTRQIHQPLVRLLKEVRSVAAGSQPERLATRTFSELGMLEEAFNEMATKVFERQVALQTKVQELSIRIDSQRRKEQLDSIVETDYFRHLEMNAERLRDQLKATDALARNGDPAAPA